MLISSTSAVAAIIQAVSAASIFGGAACASASVAETAMVAVRVVANKLRAIRRADAMVFMWCPPSKNGLNGQRRIRRSERLIIGFAGADAHGPIEIEGEN